MIDKLTIDSQGVSFFDITADGQEFILDRDADGGEWHLSWEKGGRRAWVASGKVEWPDALARAVRQVDKHLNSISV